MGVLAEGKAEVGKAEGRLPNAAAPPPRGIEL